MQINKYEDLNDGELFSAQCDCEYLHTQSARF